MAGARARKPPEGHEHGEGAIGAPGADEEIRRSRRRLGPSATTRGCCCSCGRGGGTLAWRLCGLLRRLRRRRLPGRPGGVFLPLSLNLSLSPPRSRLPWLERVASRVLVWDGFVEKGGEGEEREGAVSLSYSAAAADVSAAIKSGFLRGRTSPRPTQPAWGWGLVVPCSARPPSLHSPPLLRPPRDPTPAVAVHHS